MPEPDPQALMDEFTKFGMYTSIIGAILFVLGFIFVTSLNFTAENQVCELYTDILVGGHYLIHIAPDCKRNIWPCCLSRQAPVY